MSSLPIIDKFFRSVLRFSPGSNSADALVSWFCDNSPQSVYKLAKFHLRKNTEFIWEGLQNPTFHMGDL